MWPEQIGFILLELGPTPFPLPPSSAKQRLFQTATADNRGLLLSLTPSWRAFFLEKAGLQHLSSCPQLPTTETKSQMSMAQRWGLLSAQLPLKNGGSISSAVLLGILGPDPLGLVQLL